MKARTIARYVAVTLMGVAVLVATGDGFAQSYAGLYGWAIEHGLSGWKADSFPLLVDLFVGVGEMGLFLIAIDGHRLRRSLMSWLDLLVPLLVAASGWCASLVFNVGHTRHVFSYQATAAVPPLASMIGLLVLLRTLHRYVAQVDEQVRETAAEVVDETPVTGLPEMILSHPDQAAAVPVAAGSTAPADLAEAVISARLTGRSERDVAEAFGISRYRVKKIFNRHAPATEPAPGQAIGLPGDLVETYAGRS